MDNLVKIMDGRPLEKLIEVVSNAIGTLYEPRQIVRKAKAEAKAESIIAIEQAKTQAIIDGDLEKVQYLERINNRIVNKEVKRQNNIEEVVSTAGKILESEEKVSEEPLNSDWTTRFFNIVQDVSDNEMQLLWGQILAGEIKQPKSYSLRTLELLRNMTKDDAELFQKVAQLTLVCGDAFLYTPNNDLRKFGIDYMDIAKLIEIGLLRPGDFVQRHLFPQKLTDTKTAFIYGDVVVIVNIKANSKEISFPIRSFTTSGQELCQLIDISPNMDYIKEFADAIKNMNVKVTYSHIVSIDKDGVIHYKTPEIEIK